MSPFYFGTRERRLFGIYEPASCGTAGNRAAILCYPWGLEYLHAHPTLRQLARKLSAIGVHTLRFDFFGTGDSGGEAIDANLKAWETDLKMAMEEIGEIAGTSSVSLIGLRLGAAVTATVAADNKVDALVLWDPVVSGKEYLNQLGVAGDAEPPIEIQGFPLAEKMLRDLRAFELNRLILKRLPRTLMLITERLPSHGSLMSSATCSASLDFMTDVYPWSAAAFTNGMIPYKVIQRILAWLE